MSLPPLFLPLPCPSGLPLSRPWRQISSLVSLNSFQSHAYIYMQSIYTQMATKFKIHFSPLPLILDILYKGLGSLGFSSLLCPSLCAIIKLP